MKDKQTNEDKVIEWEKEFDSNYDINKVEEWTLGIIAMTLVHSKKYKQGSDASYLTAKLRKLVEQAIQATKEEAKKNFKLEIIKSMNKALEDCHEEDKSKLFCAFENIKPL